MSDELRKMIEIKIQKVVNAEPWMQPEALARTAHRIVWENSSYRNRRTKLITLANRFNGALAPETACHPGCNACCSLPTMIYQHEAVEMAKASGRPMATVTLKTRAQAQAAAIRDLGRPCPFLTDGLCSVYEARPLICRLHHSMNLDNSACDASIPVHERKPTASYNVDYIEMPYHDLVTTECPTEPWAHIHAFFPSQTEAKD